MQRPSHKEHERQSVARINSEVTTPSLRRTLLPIYVVAALRLLLPLFVLPLVASRVGPDEFGRLSFIVVWAGLLSTVVEGGFLAAATRLAVNAEATRRWSIAQQIFTARMVLCLPVIALSAGAVRWAGDPNGAAGDAWMMAALACALGWPATWYLQATHQLAAWARVELVIYAMLLLLCYAFARSVASYLALQLAACSLLAVIGWRWVWHDLAPHSATTGRRSLWRRQQLAAGLRLGWTMMPISLAGAAYSFALPAAASSQMTKSELGVYYMADRIVRALLAAADPVFSVVYPRIVALFASTSGGESVSLRYALRWAVAGALAGAAMLTAGILLWDALAPQFAHRWSGLNLHALRAVMEILVWLLPLLLAWKFVGYWMLASSRYDRAYRSSMIIGAVVGVSSALTVGGRAGATGLALTALGVELIVIATAVTGVLITRRLRA